MAVRVSTTTRVCLYCKIKSDANDGKEFHEIFDEVGLELQLPSLVKTYFHIDLNKKTKQSLCADCVNRLIELYDLDEHVKEESRKTILKIEPECVNEECSKYFKNESGNHKYECKNFHKPLAFRQNNTQVTSPKSNYIEYTNFETFVSTQGEDAIEIKKQNRSEDNDRTENENIENVEYFFNKNRSQPFIQPHDQSSIDIVEDYLEEDFDLISEREVSKDFKISLSPSAITAENSEELESNEHIEFIIDYENQNVEINKQSNTNIVCSKELETREEYQIETNEEIEVLSEIESKTKEKVFLHSDQNDYVEENLCDEVDEAAEAYTSNKTHNANEGQQYLYVEEVDDVYDEEELSSYYEKESSNQVIYSGDSNSLPAEIKIIEEKEDLLLNSNSSATEFYNTEHIDADDLIEQEDISDDTYSLEEEYLIEEIILSEEHDKVDLNEYLDKILITKFQDLQLNWETECKLCLEKYYSFGELLNHACIAEFEEEQQLFCIFKDCEEHAKELPTLARHLVLRHYNKLESTAIYGKCTDCQKTFSNILDFNKHSCCRNIKRKTGAPNYCKYCDLDFQSLKRYVFHMQFHLINHRPKICLLCGDLFNNSNDFFEHTQYKHNPETALACVRCDRFFKDIKVFNNHMELHEDFKYQYECTLCPKKYTNKFGLNQHMDIYHNNKSNALQCEYCAKEFVNKTSYRNHIKSHATDAKVQTFICSTCGLITNNMEIIKEHIESDNESPCFSSPVDEKILGLGYSCENCSLDFCTIKHLKEHRLSDSHSDDLFHCGMCTKSFNTLRHMRNHSINHKEFKEWQESFPITRHFVCNIGDCQEFYPIWTSLYYHKKRPHKSEEKTNSPTEFKCQFCHQLCSSKMSLAVHVARSHNNANIKCSYCKRNFNSRNILQKHIDKFHTPVECDVCLKKFKHRRNLETHMNSVHNNIKRYFCKHCKKGYFHKNERNLHEKKVHPKNSFKCNLCNFETTYPASLEIHMDRHNNRLKFKCSICSKSFGRKQLLECHLKRHQNQKDYSCARYLNESGCDASFLTYNLLKKHAQTKHKNSTFSINLKKDEHRKKDHGVQFENISYKILTCDNSSEYEKHPKTSQEIHFNDDDFEQDAIVLTLENDMEFEDHKSEAESLTI